MAGAVRWFIALLAAHYILYVPQQHPFRELLQFKGYYIALGFTTITAWLLLQMSRWLHRQLRLWIPFGWNFFYRLLVQLLLSVSLLFTLNMLMVRAYFWFFHQNFERSGYLQVEAQLVLWMLFCLQVFLISYEGYQEHQQEKMERLHDQEFIHFINGSKGKKKIKIALDEIICLYKESHTGYVHLINGETWNTDYTMNQLEAKLSPNFGFRVNRSLIVSWAAIKAYEPIANMQGLLLLRYKVDKKINLKISRYRFRNFKKYYHQYKVSAQQAF